MTSLVSRRRCLGAFAAAAFGASAGVPAAPFPDTATLLAGGPPGSAADDWAGWLTPGLARALPSGTVLRKDDVGGADGVTAANQFGARAVPDGSAALLVPGAAALAWLCGDPRAQFDASQWVPVLAACTSMVVVSRLPLQTIRGGALIRLGASRPAGPDLPSMLALDLLGAAWSPVFGLGEDAALQALLQGRLEAVCLHGRAAERLAAQAEAGGAHSLFTFGVASDTGLARDPAFPTVPTYAEIAPATVDPALHRVLLAAAASAKLDIAMVLPPLTPPAIVSGWRKAAAASLVPARPLIEAAGLRALASPGAGLLSPAVMTDAAGQLALRHWMSRRLDWQPA